MTLDRDNMSDGTMGDGTTGDGTVTDRRDTSFTGQAYSNTVDGRDEAVNDLNGAPGSPLPLTENWQFIKHLKGSDYQVTDGDPNITGWKVTSRDGREMGKVTDLLIDTRHMMVEYIEVEKAHDEAHRMILPIRTAVLDKDAKEVQFLGMSAEALALTPHDPYHSAAELQQELERFYGTRRT